MTETKRVVITGGAGFVGSNLCERFLGEGWRVVAIDNLITGTNRNLDSMIDNDAFEVVNADITKLMNIDGPVDLVLHFASLASPLKYFKHQLETLRAGSDGTFNTLDMAQEKGARYLVASSSEVYGDPQVYEAAFHKNSGQTEVYDERPETEGQHGVESHPCLMEPEYHEEAAEYQ